MSDFLRKQDQLRFLELKESEVDAPLSDTPPHFLPNLSILRARPEYALQVVPNRPVTHLFIQDCVAEVDFSKLGLSSGPIRNLAISGNLPFNWLSPLSGRLPELYSLCLDVSFQSLEVLIPHLRAIFFIQIIATVLHYRKRIPL
jgi:hypothetical protein